MTAPGTPRPAQPIVRSASCIEQAKTPTTDPSGRTLPLATDVLVVCAHPDDESFGLGAVLAAFAVQGTKMRVLCLTHGEASTLGTHCSLAEVRAAELHAAADALGVDHVELHSYPDGQLPAIPLDELTDLVENAIGGADLVLVFDEGGITGHPDHRRATQAAVAAAMRRDVPVLAWALPDIVATQLNAELGTSFVGRPLTEIAITIEVDRVRQHEAIACHASQSDDNPVLRRRLELLGGREHLTWLSQRRATFSAP